MISDILMFIIWCGLFYFSIRAAWVVGQMIFQQVERP